MKEQQPNELWRDLKPLLDEELARLPERLRAPLIACCLEGQSQEAASSVLGMNGRTLQRRLAQGRERLRHLLAQRGIVLSTGVLCGLIAENASAGTLPAGCAAETTKVSLHALFGGGAGCGSASPQAAALMNGVLRSMFWSKLQMAAVITLAVAGSLSALAIWITSHRSTVPATTPAVAQTARNNLDDGSRYLSIEDVLQTEKMLESSPLAVSPDGTWVAFCVQAPHDERVCVGNGIITEDGVPSGNFGATLRVVHLPDGDTSQPFGEGTYAVSPSWSPDGRRLATWVRDGGFSCLGTWEPATGRKTIYHNVPVLELQAWDCPVWFPDSRRLLARSLRKDPDVPEEHASRPEDRVLYRERQKSIWSPCWTRAESLAVVDTQSGNVKTLTLEAGCNPRVSPDGRKIAMPVINEVLNNGRGVASGIDIIDVENPQNRRSVIKGMSGNFIPVPVWSPDSKRLAWSFGGSAIVSSVDDNVSLWTLPAPPGETGLRWPVWTRESDALCFAQNTGVWRVDIATKDWKLLTPRTLAAEWLDDSAYTCRSFSFEPAKLVKCSSGVVRVNLTTGETQEVCGQLPPERLRSVSANDSVVCGGDVWACDLKTGKSSRIFTLKSGEPTKRLRPKQLSLTWNVGSQKAKGTVYLPHDYKEGVRLPTILHLYPADSSEPFQPPDILVSEGFAVFVPEIPLSSKAEIVAATEAAADAAVAAGWADPAFLGVIGHDLGGYAASCVADSSKRFRAVISLGGTSPSDAEGESQKRTNRLAPLMIVTGTGQKPDFTQADLDFTKFKEPTGAAVSIKFGGAEQNPSRWPAHARRALSMAITEWFRQHLRSPDTSSGLISRQAVGYR